MGSSRTRSLEKLAANLPGANQRVTQGLQAARQTQLQNQLSQMGQGTPQAAQQQLAGQQTAAAGQINLQGAQNLQTQQTQVGQLGLQQQARGQRQKAAEQQLTLGEREMKFANQLTKLDSKLKNELLDKQLAFNQDEAGRTLFNTRQRADWVASNARSEEELKGYMQTEQLAHSRNIKMLEMAHRELEQTLMNGYLRNKQELDQASKKRIIEAKKQIEDNIRKAKEKANNNRMIGSAIGTIVGAGIGAVVGGPAGAVAGAQAGSGVGTMIGSRF